MSSPRHSISSSSSGGSSPRLSAIDSSAALILVHDEDLELEDNNTPFDISDEDDDAFDPQFEVRSASIPPLSPSVVFLYLLSPYLKLGAMFLPNTGLPLKYGIPPLVLFALLSTFARQIWYMLARYLRKADMEDVILDAFARGRGKERVREVIRVVIRGGTGSLRILLAMIYLRESVHVLLPLYPDNLRWVSRFITTAVLALAVLPICFAQSLASKRLIYATWVSIATYVLWLSCVSYAYSQGTLQVSPSWLRLGAFWQGITTTAFAFTSSSTLSLYASLKGSTQPVTTAKIPRGRSFDALSVLSVSVAVPLILPLTFFSSHPNTPLHMQETPGSRLQPFIAVLHATTLMLAIPPILITTPSLPILIPARMRRSTSFSISKFVAFILVALLSLVPAQLSTILSDVLLFCALSSTYFLPAFVHIIVHFFKRPLSIIVPRTPSFRTPSVDDGLGPPLPPPSHDELLQRKERALQRRQFHKRIVWDIGVWVLLLPVGGGGFVWVVGRLLGQW